jgi:hypothetical protein
MCPSSWIDIALCGFMRWCSQQRIMPDIVDDGVLAAYVDHRDQHDLNIDLAQLRRQVARAWSKCVKEVPGWPERLLQHEPAR